MALTRVAASAVVFGTTTVTPATPTGTAAGDAVLIFSVSKDPAIPLATSVDGWAVLTDAILGTTAATGIDVGPVRLTVFSNNQISSTTMPAITGPTGTPSVISAQAVTYRPDAGEETYFQATSRAVTTASTTFGGTFPTMNIGAGDQLLCLSGGTSDTPSPTAGTATATGLTIGAVTVLGNLNTTNGNDERHALFAYAVTAGGPVDVAPTIPITTTQATNSTGGQVLLRVRSRTVSTVPQTTVKNTAPIQGSLVAPGTISLPRLSNLAVGDLMVVLHISDNDGTLAGLTNPSGGFIEQDAHAGVTGGHPYAKLWRKIAVAADTTATSFDFAQTVTNISSSAAMIVIPAGEFDPLDPTTGIYWSHGGTALATAHPARSVSSPPGKLQVCGFLCETGGGTGGYTLPAGLTERADTQFLPGGYTELAIGTSPVLTAGAQGTETATNVLSRPWKTAALFINASPDAAVAAPTNVAGTDTFTLAESATVVRTSSVADSSTLTEAPATLAITNAVAGSDTATQTEAATLVVTGLAGTDTFTLAESAAVVVAPALPAAATIVETFDAALNPADWTVSAPAGEVTVTGGQLRVDASTSYPSATRNAHVALRGSSTHVEVAQDAIRPAGGHGSYITYMQVIGPASLGGANMDKVEIYVGGGGINANVYDPAGTSHFLAYVVYDPTAHRFLRIREAGGTLFWDVSPDAVAWTQITSSPWAGLVSSGFVDDVQIVLGGGHWDAAEDGGRPALFDNLNTVPVAITPVVGTDTATLTESAILAASQNLTASDTATETDAAALAASSTVADAATHTEAGSLAGSRAVTDAATHTEAAALTILAADAATLFELAHVVSYDAPPVGGPAGVTWSRVFSEEFVYASAAELLATGRWRSGWWGNQDEISGPVNPAETAQYDSTLLEVRNGAAIMPVVPDTLNRSATKDHLGTQLVSDEWMVSPGYMFGYGYVEARFQQPAGNATEQLWPGFWLSGHTWPDDMEIDIMEGDGTDTGSSFNIHYGVGVESVNLNAIPGGRARTVPGATSAMHVYAADIRPDGVTFYYDGVAVYNYVGAVPAATRFIMVGSSLAGTLTTRRDMTVDYIRAWIRPDAPPVPITGTDTATLTESASLVVTHAATAAVDPGPTTGPSGEPAFLWNGLRWYRRTSVVAGAPQFNGQWSEANAVYDSATDDVVLSITNPSGTAPIAGEVATTRAGWGYGTYQIVVGSDLSGMNHAVVFGGLFTYDGTIAGARSANEIDVDETSAWGGTDYAIVVDHTYFVDDFTGDGARDAIRVAQTPVPVGVHTGVMVWEPGRITWRLYTGRGTGGTLLRESTTTDRVPVPNLERLFVNLWVVDASTWAVPLAQPTTVGPHTVRVEEVSFTPPGASDRATLSESATVQAGALTAADTATLTEQASVARSTAVADTTTLTDLAALSAALTVTDAAIQSEAATLAAGAQLAVADTAAHTEQAALVAAVAGADTTALAEAVAVQAGAELAVADAATLSEAVGTQSAALLGADTASSAESVDTVAALAGVDASTLVEASPVISAGISGTDSAAHTDAGDLLAAFTASDVGTQSDAVGTQSAALAGSDPATQLEQVTLAAGGQFSVTDSATLTEAASPPAAALTGGDAGTTTDEADLAALLAGTDAATGAPETADLLASPTSVDAATVSESAELAAAQSVPTDAAAATESAQLSAGLDQTDLGNLDESSTVEATLAATDAGTHTETATVAIGTELRTGTDAAVLAEGASVAAGVQAADTAALSESSSVAGSNAPTGSDALRLSTETATVVAAATAADVFVPSETATVAALLTGSDVAALGEAGFVTIGLESRDVADTAVGSESATLAAQIAGADTGTEDDLAELAASTAGTDTATLGEAASVQAGALRAASDAATLQEVASVEVLGEKWDVADVATLAEAASLRVLLDVADTVRTVDTAQPFAFLAAAGDAAELVEQARRLDVTVTAVFPIHAGDPYVRDTITLGPTRVRAPIQAGTPYRRPWTRED